MPKFEQKIKPKDFSQAVERQVMEPSFDHAQPIALFQGALVSGEPFAITQFGSRGILSDIRVSVGTIVGEADFVLIIKSEGYEERTIHKLEKAFELSDILVSAGDKLLIELVSKEPGGTLVEAHQFWFSGTYSY